MRGIYRDPTPGKYQGCRFELCFKEATDRYPIPLCQEHVLSVWAYVDADLRASGSSGPELRAQVRADEEAADKAKAAEIPGFIYYLQVGEHLKIGHTNNLERRLREYPPNAVLLGQHLGTRADESALHGKFTAYRVAGREWYRDVAEIRGHIAAVADKPYGSSRMPRKATLRPRGSGGMAIR